MTDLVYALASQSLNDSMCTLLKWNRLKRSILVSFSAFLCGILRWRMSIPASMSVPDWRIICLVVATLYWCGWVFGRKRSLSCGYTCRSNEKTGFSWARGMGAAVKTRSISSVRILTAGLFEHMKLKVIRM